MIARINDVAARIHALLASRPTTCAVIVARCEVRS